MQSAQTNISNSSLPDDAYPKHLIDEYIEYRINILRKLKGAQVKASDGTDKAGFNKEQDMDTLTA
jgi:hypothetical protein